MKYSFLSSSQLHAWKVALMTAYIATHAYRGSIFAAQDLSKIPKKQFVKSHKVTGFPMKKSKHTMIASHFTLPAVVAAICL